MINSYTNDQAFWTQEIDKIAKNIVGERLITKDRILVIEIAEAFKGLVRKAMSTDFQSSKQREPGDLFVTQFRGSPLINVTGKTDGPVPEVVWLKQMRERGTKTVSGSALVRSVAEAEGASLSKKTDLLDFCMSNIDGKNVTDPTSPIRIIENLDMPNSERKVDFIAQGNAKNSEGVASLVNVGNGIKTIEQARTILHSEAMRLGVSIDFMTSAENYKQMCKLSPLFKEIVTSINRMK